MPRRIRSRWLRALLWIAGAVAVVAAAAYAIGGRRFYRNLLFARSRAAALLQPPTQAELQRAAAANPSNTTSVSALPTVPAVTISHIVLWVALILVVTVVLFYVTGRPRRQRPDLAGR
jgi:hypothetical protein